MTISSPAPAPCAGAGSSVTTATTRGVQVLLSRPRAGTASTSCGASTTAMRSCDSEMASSVPSRPSYFFGTLFEINFQPVGQLADGHAYAAGAKIVAALDQRSKPRVAEQALQLALGGRIALLHLGAADFDGLLPCAPWRNRSRRRMPSRPVRPPSSTITSPACRTAAHHIAPWGRRRSPRRSPCALPHSRDRTAR